MRIIDRFMLDRARLSLFAALGSEIAGWFLFGPVGASVCGTFVVAIGLASVYGTLAKSGEFTAIVAAGIAPRRAICSIVAGVVLICTIEAVLACTVRVPAVRSECAVDVFAAIVPAVAASIVLPIADVHAPMNRWPSFSCSSLRTRSPSRPARSWSAQAF